MTSYSAPESPPKARSLLSLWLRVGLDKVLLQNVSADQMVVVGKRIPEVEVAREDVADVDALLRQRFGPRRPERGAEQGVLATDPDLPAGSPDRNLASVRADADVLRVGSLELADAESEVVAQRLELLRRQFRAAERGGESVALTTRSETATGITWRVEIGRTCSSFSGDRLLR